MKIIKQSSLVMQHENQSAALSSSWSELDLDLLREINKKIRNYADRVRFRRVCRSWRSVGFDEKRAADVFPWLMGLNNLNNTEISYLLREPPFIHYDAYIYGMINLCEFFGDIISENTPTILRHWYAQDGWLYISVYNFNSNCSNLLLFSLTTKSILKLPPFNHDKAHHLYLAWSTTPDSPDCVFLAMSITDALTRTIGIFRHGDTHWTTTQSADTFIFAKLTTDHFVFINGVFYFFITYRTGGIGYGFGFGFYDLATGALHLEPFSSNLMFYKAQSFFGLDGHLMFAYFEPETRKLCIRRYDWSNKDWVPLQSLGGRSLYLSTHSLYVDDLNYSNSPNSIYVYVGDNRISCVDKYTLEDDGQLSKSTSTTLKWWVNQRPIWVPPPDVCLRR